jgi:16S rRNA (cytosine967-C5)-methyltransferase
MPVSPARSAAFEILLRVESSDAYTSELLHSARFEKLSRADHGLLTELVMGVLRWRGLLDERIAECSSRPLAKLDVEVLTALRLGAYQILFLDRIPRHAAINESVELVKSARKRSAAGMVNAVLRKTTRTTADLDVLSAHPQWLVERWAQSYGSDAARKVCEYNQVTPKPAIRISDGQLLEELRAERIQLEPGKLLAKTFVVQAGDITATKAFRERRLVIQDEASQLVALLAGSGEAILDCCAAPGGKTRILAERNPESIVLAMELHPHRAALLRKLVPLANVQIIAADATQMPFNKSFDRILVDAPCTGTGTLARNPEIKWRLQPKDISRLQTYQIELLLAAMKQVSTGGRIIHSTCSLEPEENSEVIEKALAEDTCLHVIDCREELDRLRTTGELKWDDINSLLSGPYLRTIPGVHPCDGFFAAILEKR